MTVDEKMTEDYGSVGKALREYFKAGMSNADIARKYGCSDNFIGRKIKARGLENPNNGRSRPRESSVLGIAGSESRKAMTAAMISGEGLGRVRLLEQVTHIKPGDPQFDAVAADIMRQRETCHGRQHSELLWKE